MRCTDVIHLSIHYTCIHCPVMSRRLFLISSLLHSICERRHDRSLWSADASLLSVRWTQTALTTRAFSVAAPTLGTFTTKCWDYVTFTVPTFLLTKKSRYFQDPVNYFPGPVRSPRMFKYKEKMAFTLQLQYPHAMLIECQRWQNSSTFHSVF